ncbi:MAG TPA: hypothetical protein VG844_07355 [Terracidiphilus sp.]|nr:hypothetical protein [Terracidiphilus sp.]
MKNYIDVFERLGVPIIILLVAPAYHGIKTLIRRWGTGPARGWPTISAVIDVVSVSEVIHEGQYGSAETTGYKATLTYFYRNPELEMGEYTKYFSLEGAAKRWTAGFKGKNVLVHVNPKDPSDSVLLKSDMEGFEDPAQQGLDEQLQLEEFPLLPRKYVVLSSISELIALVGICLTAAGVWLRWNHRTPTWLTITLIIMVAFNAVTAWIVTYRADDSHRFQSMLHSYKRYCPIWMRWGVNITGGLVFVTWLAAELRELLPTHAEHWLAMEFVYWNYLLAMSVFMTTGATHAAVLRSQEFAQGRSLAEPAGVSNET